MCKLTVLGLLAACFAVAAPPNTLILPVPQELELRDEGFPLDESVRIIVPIAASEADLFLARLLAAELSDRYGLAVATERSTRVPASKRIILMGGSTNPLVRQYCAMHNLSVTRKTPGPEGYVLEVDRQVALVAGSDERGAFYGLQSLRQLLAKDDRELHFRGVRVRDWPRKAFRGLKLYLPGRDNIAFFKRFVRDFMALYKYNQLILEVNAAMRLDRHPELNAGWIDLAKDLVYSRRDRPDGPHQEYQDSTHHDTGDGAVLEKDEVAELVRWARLHYIDVIPELPSLTHSYYLLTRHRELAEIQDAEWPDAYCPSNPKSYELLFDVLDEYIGVMKPRMLHVGHDEWRAPIGLCARCRGKDPRELFAEDIHRIHNYLTKKNLGMIIWGDHLIESLRGKAVFDRVSPTGYKHQWPGGLTPEQVREKIPKDILIANWFWGDGEPGEGEESEIKLAQWGFRQFYGNFTPEFRDYGRRSSRASVIGGAPSSWAATTEFNFGKDLLYDFLGCANLLWSKHWFDPNELTAVVQARMPEVRRGLSGVDAPSLDGDPVVPVNMAAHYNATLPSSAKAGIVRKGSVVFDFGEPGTVLRIGPGAETKGIPVGEDVSSLIFLHAADKPAQNDFSHRYIFNFADTAELLGHYEVVYEDGFVETIPIRYGVNILERTWGASRNPRSYGYRADPVECGDGATFFVFEWVNPRFGKAIKEVSAKGASGFRDTNHKVVEGNAVLLKALSVVKKRSFPEPVKAKTSEVAP